MASHDAVQLLDEARRLGFEVSRDGDRLHVEGPESESWFVEKLAEAKPEILDALAETETGHVRVLVLLSEPYPDEHDNADLAEGQHIIEAIETAGGWLTIEDGRIVLRWRGNMVGAGELIDRIRAARTGVVAALPRATD